MTAPVARHMRILLPSIVDPWLHRGGAGAATRGLVSLLRRPPLAAEVDVVVPASRLPHRLRQLVAVARASRSAWPSKALFLDTRPFRHAVARAVATRRHDLVLINGGDLLWLLPRLPPAVPKVLYAHNLEHDLFAAQLDGLAGPLRWARGRLRGDLDKLARYERDGMRSVGRVLFISAADETHARSAVGGLRTLLVPPLFDYAPAPRPQGARPAAPPELAFVANLTWWPNRAALRWLVDAVLPGVGRDLRLHIYGEGSDRIRVADRRVVGHGFVADVAGVFARTDVMLCPVVSGAGVSVKFAEAVYNGVPVLATPLAARGLRLPDTAGVAVVDGTDGWRRLLGGEGLDALAAQTVSTATARLFAPVTHADAVHAFLAAAVADADPLACTVPEVRCAPSR